MPRVHPKPDSSEVSNYIRRTFVKRECGRFRLKTTTNNTEVCECGYGQKVHINEALSSSTNSNEESTKTFPTDVFGKLDFERRRPFSASKDMRHLRLDHSTEPEKIVTLFKKYWKMPDPDLVISVVSDSQYSNIPQNDTLSKKSYETKKIEKETDADAQKKTKKTRDVDPEASDRRQKEEAERKFKNAIKIVSNVVDAAASANAWIITGGLDKGVDNLVGEKVRNLQAVRSRTPAVVLGISNWGCLADKKQFFKRGPHVLANYSSDDNTNGLSLGENHTHFLLADDGRQNNPGCEFTLRQNVEYGLKRSKSEEVPMSLVYVIVEGSFEAFSTVERALANGIPVIIAKGSGGAADVIANIKELEGKKTQSATSEFNKIRLPRLEEFLIPIINKVCPKDEAMLIINSIRREMKEIMTQLKKEPISKKAFYDKKVTLRAPEKLAPRQQEPIGNIPRHQETNERSMKDNKTIRKRLTSIAKQLCIDRTPEQSTPDDTGNSVDAMIMRLHEAFLLTKTPLEVATRADDELKKIHALIRTIECSNATNDCLIIFDIECNNVERNSIDHCILEALRKVNRNNPSHIHLLAANWDNEHFFKKLQMHQPQTRDLKEILATLLKGNKHKYVKLLLENGINLKDCIPDMQTDDIQKYEKMTYVMQQIKKSDEIVPLTALEDDIIAKVLFIWCANRAMPEMAVLFMHQGKNYLAMALIGYKMSKRLIKSTRNLEERERFENQKRFFSELALEFLKKCYADNRSNTHKLLVGQVEDLDGRTPLETAVKANFKTFVAEVAIQTLLKEIWIKDIVDHRKYHYLPLIVSALCPLLAPWLFKFKEPDKDSEEEADDIDEDNKREIFSKTFRGKVTRFINAPVTKFIYAFVSYLGYLALFSIVMLTDFRARVSPLEIALIVWTIILLIEEIMQHLNDRSAYRNQWSWLDYAGFLTYIIGIILRITHHSSPASCPECLYAARIVFTISLIIFYLRVLQLLCINSKLCPKIYMMRKLIGDLFVFMLILAVFVTAYGVASNAILYPNQPLNAKLLQDVFYDAWWAVVQQFNREDTLGTNCNTSQTAEEYCLSKTDPKFNVDYVWCKENRCPADNWVVSVLLAFYALITVIMMLNVLIAMFNITFSEINDRQKEVSKMQRYQLIREFSFKFMIPTPLSAIFYPFIIALKIYKLCRHCIQAYEENNGQENNGLRNKDTVDGEAATGRRWKNGLPLAKRIPKAFGKKLRSSVIEWEQQLQENYMSERGKADAHTRLAARFVCETDNKLLRNSRLVFDDDSDLIKFLQSEEFLRAIRRIVVPDHSTSIPPSLQ